MENTIVWRQINKFNKNLRWTNLLWLAAMLTIAGFQYRYLRNCFLGPQKIEAQELVKITDPSNLDRDFVTFTSEKAIDTGFNKVSVSKRSKTETTEHKYAIAVVGKEKALLVEAQPNDDLKNPTFTGGLSTISADIQTNVVDKLLAEEPVLQGRILPAILETGDYRTWSYIFLPVLLGGLGFCGWNIYRAKVRRDDPRKHPIYNSLAQHGDADATANSIDREFRAKYDLPELVTGTPYLMPSWLLFASKYNLQVTEFDKLMWVYQKVTSHSVNFIPTGKTHEIVMKDQSGREQIMKMPESHITKTLEMIISHAPWAVVGFSDDLAALWNNHREDFYEAVEERKREETS
jgi:hypothetical protein